MNSWSIRQLCLNCGFDIVASYDKQAYDYDDVKFYFKNLYQIKYCEGCDKIVRFINVSMDKEYDRKDFKLDRVEETGEHST